MRPLHAACVDRDRPSPCSRACSAAVPSHTVQPGETLWSIAAANNLTTRTVAAFNGLSENAQVVLGSTISVPTMVEGYASCRSPGIVRPATATASGASAPAAAARVRPSRPPSLGAYIVRSGDTLGGLAATSGVSLELDGRR